MNKKTQRTVALVIGLVLSLLLIYIGFRIVQKRGSQASLPEGFICKRTKDIEATCIWKSKTEDIGRVLSARMPAGGPSECNLVFINEEAGTPVALGDGNFEHTVVLQPLVANQAYCAAPGGNEDSIVEVPATSEGAAAQNTAEPKKEVVLDISPTQAPVVPTETPALEPTTAAEPTAMPVASDADVDKYYSDHAGGEAETYATCLEYFKSKGQQISGNACIRRYPTSTP